MKKDAEERYRRLLEKTKTEIGAGRVGMGDDARLVKETIPIGVPDIDNILGGGLRKGRMALIYGHESMGKSLMAQWIIKAFQERGEICGLMDPEKTYEPEWCAKTGVDTSKLIVAHPASTEQAFDLACMWSAEGMGLIVIDSLAALAPKARLESDLNDQEFMGLSPRKISEGLTKFTNDNVDSLLVCTNQIRQKIGVMWGSPDELPGGKAQKFYASYIIKVWRKGWIEEKKGGPRIGYNMVVETIKNKLASPGQSAIIPFMFSGVVDTVGGAVQLAVDLGLIPRKGAFYTWNEERYRGKNALKELFTNDDEAFESLQEMIRQGGDGESTFDTDGSV